MTISGKVISVKEKQQLTEKFAKRCLWLETDGKYPQTIEIDFVNNNCALLDNIAINEMVDVEFEVRGKQSKDRVFNSLNAWKIAAHPKADESRMVRQGSMSTPPAPIGNEVDDLPF